MDEEKVANMEQVPVEDLNKIADEVLGDDSADINKDITAAEEADDLIKDPDHPLNEQSSKQLVEMIKTAGEMVQMMEQNWAQSKKEFNLTDTQMKDVYQFNEQHRDPPPEGVKDDDESYDRFNGIDKLTEEDVVKIFGEDHLIIGVDHPQTLDRVKYTTQDFFAWISSLKEYQEVYDAYYSLVELEEDKEMAKLRAIADAEQDPVKKAKMEKSLDMYYSRKYLQFLAEPLTDKSREMLAAAYTNEKKVNYWIKRAKDKLVRLHVSPRIILEMSQFEKRFLEEKYHNRSNLLLLYFINMVTFCNPDDKHDEKRYTSVCMALVMDRIIRNALPTEQKELIFHNVRLYLDQFDGMDLK